MKRTLFSEHGIVQSVLLSFVSFWLFISPAIATTNLQSHSEIIALATKFATDAHAGSEKVEITIPPLDQRLALPGCVQELDVFQPSGSTLQGHTTIGIRCSDKKPWVIRIRAEIKVYDYIAVLSTSVRQGDELGNNNVTMKLTDKSLLRGDGIRDFGSLLGFCFKSRYSASRILERVMLDQPRLIVKGQNVSIVTENSSVRVQMKGVALTDGAKGGIVQVKNLSSGRIIEAYVAEKGVVKVQL